MANTTLKDVILQDLTNSFITENNCRKEAVITPMPLYTMDSDETDVFDFGGVIKTITLTGKYEHEDGVSALKTWVDSVEALIQGHQDVEAGYPIKFTDDLRGTLRVKVMDFDTTWIEGEATLIIWTLKLMQASKNA